MSDGQRALSVSEAMGLAKRALESITVRVVGEVSDAKDQAGWKAVYFTLCDGTAVMPCLMWRDVFAASGVTLRDGLLVEVAGSFTAYPPKGRMQFQVRSIAAAGEGVLRMQVAALARKLEAEGLMRPERKRALPAFPRRIGLVTSPRGKAVHDVIRTLSRRYPVAELVIAGVQVEGADAVERILDGMAALAAEPGVEVVILARGGGSYEDLMPFNDERVARAVVSSPAPVVTGIGHEPDVSVADLVADLRASTPTAAAEAVAPSAPEVDARFSSLARLLGRGLTAAVRGAEHRVAIAAASAVIRDPRLLLSVSSQRVDLAVAGLSRGLPRVMERSRERADADRAALRAAGPRMLERFGERVSSGAARLSDLSPLGILARGYAVCYDASGRRVVRSVSDIAPGETIRLRLVDGLATCDVLDITAEER